MNSTGTSLQAQDVPGSLADSTAMIEFDSERLELLLFRLGQDPGGRRELFGINVFKVREVLLMPQLTALPGAPPQVLGLTDLRGQLMPVVDLPAVTGCRVDALQYLVVTEFERSVQAFAVEQVEQIVRLDWNRVLSAQAHAVGGLVSAIARLHADARDSPLALVLDLEKILADVLPSRVAEASLSQPGTPLALAPGSVVLAADDSFVARMQIEKVLQSLHAPVVLAGTGREAWQRLQDYARAAQAEGCALRDKVALLLTDLEMPELDGFELTRRVKSDDMLRTVPVVVHSSLTGHASEQHARRAGADGYVSKFAPDELAAAIREAVGAPLARG